MPEVTADQLTRTYLKIKARRDELRHDYEAEDKVLKQQQEEVKRALLDYCRDNNVESTRTAHGTFYRQVKTRYWTSDWDSMHKFVLEHGVPEFLEKRLNQGIVKQFLEENPELSPPGLNADSEYVITVRKESKK